MLRTFAVVAVVGALGLLSPLANPSAARADDDWEDRIEDWEDYFEELAEQNEDQHDAWVAARHWRHYRTPWSAYRRQYVQPYGYYYHGPSYPYRHYYPSYSNPYSHGYWLRVGPLQFHWH